MGGHNEDDHEETADFDDVKRSLNEEDEVGEESLDPDKPIAPVNVNGSAFFSRDFRVLEKATYGNQD